MLYSSVCDQCGTSHSYVRSVAERHETPECCGVATRKTIDAPMVSAMAFAGTHKGMVAYANDGTPVQLDSGSDVKRYMRENDKVSEAEGASEAAYRRQEAEKKLAHDRRQAVESAYQELAN